MRAVLRGIGGAFCAALVWGCPVAVQARSTFPDRPIRIVVPWPAGGSVDMATRMVSSQVAAGLGQPVVVENRPGAAGNIGAMAAAKSAPDGYTLLMATTPMIINSSLTKGTSVDLARDFTPVSLLVNLNYVLVVNPSVANSVGELIAKAKASPGQLSYASSGPGTQLHLIGEAFKRQAGIDIVHVPYKGAPPALTDMAGGVVQMMFPGFPVVEPLLKAGRLKALAVVGSHRLPYLPGVPTLAEAGVPGIESTEWYGVVAPTGTPAEVVARLNGEFAKVLNDPGIRQRLASRGFQPVGGTPQGFAEFIGTEQKKWPALVKQAGLQ